MKILFQCFSITLIALILSGCSYTKGHLKAHENKKTQEAYRDSVSRADSIRQPYLTRAKCNGIEHHGESFFLILDAGLRAKVAINPPDGASWENGYFGSVRYILDSLVMNKYVYYSEGRWVKGYSYGLNTEVMIADIYIDDVNLSTWLLKNGWGIKNDRVSKQLVAEAQQQGLGYWAGKGLINGPWSPISYDPDSAEAIRSYNSNIPAKTDAHFQLVDTDDSTITYLTVEGRGDNTHLATKELSVGKFTRKTEIWLWARKATPRHQAMVGYDFWILSIRCDQYDLKSGNSTQSIHSITPVDKYIQQLVASCHISIIQNGSEIPVGSDIVGQGGYLRRSSWNAFEWEQYLWIERGGIYDQHLLAEIGKESLGRTSFDYDISVFIPATIDINEPMTIKCLGKAKKFRISKQGAFVRANQ